MVDFPERYPIGFSVNEKEPEGETTSIFGYMPENFRKFPNKSRSSVGSRNTRSRSKYEKLFATGYFGPEKK
jgi:hypothetical protein